MQDTLTSIAKESSKPKDYVISIDGDISKESLEEIIEAYNELDDGEYLFVYLFSSGGRPEYAEAIIHLINENCDRTVLVAFGEICSAAFDIFFRSICERKILPGTSGMAHFCRVPVVTIKNNSALGETEKNNIAWSKTDAKRKLDFYAFIGFTKKELRTVETGKDIWFTDERMKELLNNHIKAINAGFN